jgi:hypothetical protein
MKIIFLLLNIFILHNTYATSKKEPWIQITKKNGITIWKKNFRQSSLVSFKGSMILDADIHQVFSVLYDPYHKKEFIQNCDKFELLKVSTLPESTISYMKMKSPFPLIDDRDVVIQTKTEILNKQKAIRVNFWNTTHPLRRPQKGIVRIPLLKGQWILQSLSEGKTNVQYQLVTNPGGLIPKWIVNLANKKLPFKTLTKMKGLVHQPHKFTQTQTMLKYFFNFTPLLGKNHPASQRNAEEKHLVEKRLKNKFKEGCRSGILDACQMETNFKL